MISINTDTTRTDSTSIANHNAVDTNLEQVRLLDLYDAMSAATGGLDLSIDADAIERMLDEPSPADES